MLNFFWIVLWWVKISVYAQPTSQTLWPIAAACRAMRTLQKKKKTKPKRPIRKDLFSQEMPG